jgi:malate dehydrogenase (oxaloacetate-decarboxylating)(NADP+)
MPSSTPRSMSSDLKSGSLVYHAEPRPGKLEIRATKPLGNQRDMALAYSPGVAAVSEAIHADPSLVSKYTSRANLVGVVTNGTAVLGLGNIGPLAAKPVMEGKAVLFKKFADIDVFDIELAETSVEGMVSTVAALEPTFGGINLEDIKAPECFEIEEQLRQRMNIPVFHDDQHGTAVIVGAAVTNALMLAGKDIAKVKIVASGAGAAALACLNQLVSLGADVRNIWVTDLEGVVYKGREKLMDRWKAVFAQATEARTLAEVIRGRHFPGAVGGRRAEAGPSEADGKGPADPGAGQPRPRNHAGGGHGSEARRHDLHRALRLSEPGEQRPVLSLHLPRRA